METKHGRERCVRCGTWVTSCGKKVYAFDYEINKPVVVSPQACMVGCTNYATICTRDAIEFPSPGYIRQLIRERKVQTQAKNLLRDLPEEYDVRLK